MSPFPALQAWEASPPLATSALGSPGSSLQPQPQGNLPTTKDQALTPPVLAQSSAGFRAWFGTSTGRNHPRRQFRCSQHPNKMNEHKKVYSWAQGSFLDSWSQCQQGHI